MRSIVQQTGDPVSQYSPRPVRTLLASVAALAFAAGAGPIRAQAPAPVGLTVGCNNVTLTWPTGTPADEVAAAVSPTAAVVAIWRFDAATQRFAGFAPGFASISDLNGVGRLDAVFVCVGQAATLSRPSLDASAPPVSHGGPVRDYVSLVDALRAAGAQAEPDGPVDQPFFSVPGVALLVDSERVQVFEYADETAARAAVATVSPDAGTIGRTSVSWVAPPHVFSQGRIIVLYVGADPRVLGRLSAVLGPQVAGR